jgi:ADP-ribose pyrophosphatase YjhB (NUDIX family)
MNRRVAVRGIIVNENGQLLAVRQKQYTGRATVDTNDYWCTPGGGVDEGEALLPALERELVEELGVSPVIGNLLFVQQFVHNDTEHLEFFFHVTNARDYREIDLTQTTHGAVEIASVDFIDPARERLLPAFLTNQNLTAQLQPGASTQFFDSVR